MSWRAGPLRGANAGERWRTTWKPEERPGRNPRPKRSDESNARMSPTRDPQTESVSITESSYRVNLPTSFVFSPNRTPNVGFPPADRSRHTSDEGKDQAPAEAKRRPLPREEWQ